jgi:D-beta-D-heptose 7-phosphate kinase/D-beta-D-heptose 1-phosphate adenosyltransferase
MTDIKDAGKKIISSENIKRLREIHKDNRIVFTNGCYDLIHAGHCAMLRKAAAFGDILVVGVNSDESIRKIKGPNRPIIDEAARVLMLEAMEFIDYIVLFNEETPIELIKSLRPNVLVKGSDYTKEEVIGNEFVTSTGGTVELIDLVESMSTSRIIEKIMQVYGNHSGI